MQFYLYFNTIWVQYQRTSFSKGSKTRFTMVTNRKCGQVTSHCQESTTVQSRFKPIFKCTSCYSLIRNNSLKKTIPDCRRGITKSTLRKVQNCRGLFYIELDVGCRQLYKSFIVPVIHFALVCRGPHHEYK